MHFPTKHHHKDSPPTLPTLDEQSSSKPASQDAARKDTSSTDAPVTKPLPTRNPSTRIQAPTRTTSHASTKPSNITRGPSTRSEKPQRPVLSRRRTTARTRYIDMLLGLDDVSPLHNLLASLFVWILLAGYIVFPATFNKLSAGDLDQKADSELERHALNVVKNVPLLYIAAFACGIGVVGCLWMWWVHRENYIWVINRIFLPALLNSIAGLISTIVNIYSAQDGQYSVTAKVTVVVTACCSTVAAGLFLFYNMFMLRVVKRRHEREIREADRWEGEGPEGDGDVVIERQRGVYTTRDV